MIVICGTSDSISRLFFISFFQNFDFLGHKWVISAKKKGPKMTKACLSVVLYISGTMLHMILFCGTHV